MKGGRGMLGIIVCSFSIFILMKWSNLIIEYLHRMESFRMTQKNLDKEKKES